MKLASLWRSRCFFVRSLAFHDYKGRSDINCKLGDSAERKEAQKRE